MTWTVIAVADMGLNKIFPSKPKEVSCTRKQYPKTVPENSCACTPNPQPPTLNPQPSALNPASGGGKADGHAAGNPPSSSSSLLLSSLAFSNTQSL